MVRKRLLLLLKPLDVYPAYESSIHTTTTASASNRHKVLRYLYNRTLAHKNAINFCQNILEKKFVDWKAVFRGDLSKHIHDVDLVITVGGDGTLLQASHLMDDSIPVLGVNSDPTQPKEEQNSVKNSMQQEALDIFVLPLPATLNRYSTVSLRIARNHLNCHGWPLQSTQSLFQLMLSMIFCLHILVLQQFLDSHSRSRKMGNHPLYFTLDRVGSESRQALDQRLRCTLLVDSQCRFYPGSCSTW